MICEVELTTLNGTLDTQQQKGFSVCFSEEKSSYPNYYKIELLKKKSVYIYLVKDSFPILKNNFFFL